MTDLRATLDLLGERITSLTGQRDRLVTPAATVEDGQSLSPIPPRVVAFHDALAQAASGDTTRNGVRRLRDFLVLAYLRGDVDDILAVFDEAVERLQIREVDSGVPNSYVTSDTTPAWRATRARSWPGGLVQANTAGAQTSQLDPERRDHHGT